MSSLLTLAIVAAGFLLYSLVSGRVQQSILTAPLLFCAFGFAIASSGLDMGGINPGHSAIHVIAEVTLILVLFSDAARIDLKRLRGDHNLPVRMLVAGLPMTMLAGTLVAVLLLPALSIWEAALLAALLAPTDAALGQAVVSNEAVPIRMRQTINIESGLNDGIALPAVLMFAALASALPHGGESTNWLQFGALQIVIGPIVGALVGYVGARLIDRAADSGWAATTFLGIAILALAGLCYVASELVGGNGFIAAFVGGMTFGNSIRHPCTFLLEFMETEGQLLMLIAFLVFGAVLLPEGLADVQPVYFVYAALSLTVIRMLPIALSLLGAGVRLPSILFLGWFGPRGLASILFVLLVLEEAEMLHRPEILSVTVITVMLSIVLHGVSATPLAKAYGRWTSGMRDCEETREVGHMPYRTGSSGR